MDNEKNDECQYKSLEEIAGEHIAKAFNCCFGMYGVDINSEHMKNTPLRIAKMWLEMCQGYLDMDFDFTEFVYPYIGEDDWIIVKDIEFNSFCLHHLLPFFGVVHIGYVPNESFCGLSKIPRVVDHFSNKPQVQEFLGKEIYTFLKEKLEPKKLVVVIEAKHTCMACRGIKSRNSSTITTHPSSKEDLMEFMGLLK